MDSSAYGCLSCKQKRLSAEGVAREKTALSPNSAKNPTSSKNGSSLDYPASSDRVRNSYGEIRLGLVRGVVDYDDGYDYDITQRLYKKWVKGDEYLLLREEEALPNYSRRRWFAVKCSKRGNDVYNARVKKRLDGVLDALKLLVKCMNPKQRDIKKTNALSITLSYDTKLKSRKQAWLDVGKEWNAFLSALKNESFEEYSKRGKKKKKSRKKKKPRKIKVIRSWETFENGYPHIHALLVFEKKRFIVWPQRCRNKYGKPYTKWRTKNWVKDRIAGKWHSFVDVQGVVDCEKALKYVVRYVVKEKNSAYRYVDEWDKKELLTAVGCWFFRKRSFSISKSFSDLKSVVCIFQTKKIKKTVQRTLEDEKAVKKYELLGIIAGAKAGLDGYVWCKTYLKRPEWIEEVHEIGSFSDSRMRGWDAVERWSKG